MKLVEIMSIVFKDVAFNFVLIASSVLTFGVEKETKRNFWRVLCWHNTICLAEPDRINAHQKISVR